MPPLYVFSCGEHETEAIRPVGTDAIACHCGQQAQRRSVYAPAIVQKAVTAPAIAQKEIRYHGRDFIEASSEIAERSDELSKREGVPVKTPDYFSMAMKRAKQMRARGATPHQVGGRHG